VKNNETMKNYLVNGKLDFDHLIDDFYGYVYIVVKNSISLYITDEDIEEIISDIFVALWKNSNIVSNDINLKAYLTGIAKNTIKNKYRKTQINFSISEYEEKLIDSMNLEKIVEENEQNQIIKNSLNILKKEEYKTFIMFYYESKTIKEISQTLKISESKVKIILHRVRKKIKKILEDGGYSYGK